MTAVLSHPRPVQVTAKEPSLSIDNLFLLRRALPYLAPTYLLLLTFIFANDWLGRIWHFSIKFYSPGVYLFQSPFLSLKYYGLFLLLGLVAGLITALKAGLLWQLKAEETLTMFSFCMVGGSLGARLYYVALCWPHFARAPEEIFNASLGGLSIHGCILGVFLALTFYCRFNGKKTIRFFDLICTNLPLAQSIWRWGNLFNSEAVGAPVSACALLQQLVSPSDRPAGFSQSASFHPAFLYEAIWDFSLFCLLYFGLAKSLANRPGLLTCIYLGAYSLGRLLTESIRLDGITYGALDVPSIVSLACLIASAITIQLLLSKRLSRPG